MPTSTGELPLLTLAHEDFLVEDDDRAPLVASFVGDRQSHFVCFSIPPDGRASLVALSWSTDDTASLVSSKVGEFLSV